MKKVIAALAVLLFVGIGGAGDAFAQSRGRVGLGVGVTTIRPRAPELKPTSFLSVIARLNPGKGWGLAGALDWFDADLGGDFEGVGRTEVRPVMGGVGYGFRNGPLSTSLSVVAGPAFNKIRLNDSARDEFQIVKSQRITFCVRPGASLTFDIAPRVGLTAFAGYMFNRPHYTLRTSAGDLKTRWSTDAAVLSAGVVFSPF